MPGFHVSSDLVSPKIWILVFSVFSFQLAQTPDYSKSSHQWQEALCLMSLSTLKRLGGVVKNEPEHRVKGGDFPWATCNCSKLGPDRTKPRGLLQEAGQEMVRIQLARQHAGFSYKWSGYIYHEAAIFHGICKLGLSGFWNISLYRKHTQTIDR